MAKNKNWPFLIHENIFPHWHGWVCGNCMSQCRVGSCIVDDALSGPFVVNLQKYIDTHSNKQIEVNALINPSVFFYQPISDLKALMPTQFDASGQKAKAFADLTFGGIVPQGDFVSKYCSFPYTNYRTDLPIDCTAFVKK